MATETWYVMEDGSCGDPREIASDAKGILRHKDGRAVAYRPDGETPRSRGVDAEAERAKAAAGKNGETDEMRDAVEIPADWHDLPWPGLASLAAKVSPTPIKSKAEATAAIEAALARRAVAATARDMKPEQNPGAGYKTRETKAD